MARSISAAAGELSSACTGSSDQHGADGVADEPRRDAAQEPSGEPPLPVASHGDHVRLEARGLDCEERRGGPVRSVVVTSIPVGTSWAASASAAQDCLRSCRSGSAVSAGMTDATDSTRPAWITPASSIRAPGAARTAAWRRRRRRSLQGRPRSRSPVRESGEARSCRERTATAPARHRGNTRIEPWVSTQRRGGVEIALHPAASAVRSGQRPSGASGRSSLNIRTGGSGVSGSASNGDAFDWRQRMNTYTGTPAIRSRNPCAMYSSPAP